MRKGLVVGIILLFLGVGFQPALAKDVSTNVVSDVDEDCFECQPMSRVDLLKVKLLLIRIEAITDVIVSRFGHIPEIQEKCEEVLDIINSDIHWNFSVICAFIDTIYTSIYNIFKIAFDLYDYFFYNQSNPILAVILLAIIGSLEWSMYILYVSWEIFDCSLLQL